MLGQMEISPGRKHMQAGASPKQTRKAKIGQFPKTRNSSER